MQSQPSEYSQHDFPEEAQRSPNQTTHDGLPHPNESSSELSLPGAVPDIDGLLDSGESTRIDVHSASGTTQSRRLKGANSAVNAFIRDINVDDNAINTHFSLGQHAKQAKIQDNSAIVDTKLEDLPNEVLTHILSHCPPQALTTVSLVSSRLHSLVTTPHAWRSAFARYFPGSDQSFRNTANFDVGQIVARQRYFGRLSTLASWRSEYILRTNLLRALNRARPGEAIATKPRSTNLTVAHLSYFSGINVPITDIDALLSNNPNRPQPKFMHGAAQAGIVTISEPSAGKADAWGFRDGWNCREFSDMYPGEFLYGLQPGLHIGVPNSLAVSCKYGMLSGEGLPNGRLWFRSNDEQRGGLCGRSLPLSRRESGIPLLNPSTEAICSMWLARSSNLPDISQGLVGMLVGSSSGVLTAYSLGTNNIQGRRLERREMTARWVLSPGVPIIALAVDEQYSNKRHQDGRVWIVALNALGEVFYATELPQRDVVKQNAPLDEEMIYELAWKMGRTISWSLAEPTRRVARIDPYDNSSYDGSYSPRGSSDAMGLSKEQIIAETQEIEQYFSKTPIDFQRICEGWDMRRRLEVDFTGCNDNSAGEAIVVFGCGLDNSQNSYVKRFTRFRQKDSITPQAVASQSPILQPRSPDVYAPHDTPSWSFDDVLLRRDSDLNSASSSIGTFETWRVSILSFGTTRSLQLSTTTLDCSKFALLTMSEDPLINMAASTGSSPMDSPVSGKAATVKPNDIPGQRARFVAAGTMTGAIYIWNIRAPNSSSSEMINTIEPLKIIYTESPQISCLALTSLYVVHGGNDGMVQAWDPLSSSKEAIRTINGKFRSRARHRIAQAELSVWGVGINLFAAAGIWIDPDPAVLRGMVSLGGHLRYWSYNSDAAKQHKSSKRRARRSERGNNHGGDRLPNRSTRHDFITNERLEMEREISDRRKEQARLADRYGTDLLGPGATEEEIMAYALSISEESAKDDNLKRSNTSHNNPFTIDEANSGMSELYSENLQDDGALAAAIQASLEESEHYSSSFAASSISQPYSIRYTPSKISQSPPVPGSSTQPSVDDLDFALQLSLAEQQSLVDADKEILLPCDLLEDLPDSKGKARQL